MGITCSNTYVCIHIQPGPVTTIEFRGHQQNIGKDSAYNVAITERANIVANAQSSQADFDTVMSALTGTWYNQWSSAWRADFRQAAIAFG